MKLLSLNTWGGIVGEPLLQFLKEQAAEVDVFCFQEVYSSDSEFVDSDGERANLFETMQNLFSDFDSFYAPAEEGMGVKQSWPVAAAYGLASFVRKGLPLTIQGEIFVYGVHNSWDPENGVTCPRNLQYLQFELVEKQLTIANLHGLWNGGGKGDSEARLEQSRITREFLDQQSGEKILCGDLNLLPDTQSLAILEQGMNNLITENGITSTRSHLYTKENKFADYTLVSPGVQVKHFEVLPDVVSDHLAMLLDFEV